MPKVLHVITGLSVGGAELMLARLLERMDRSRSSSAVVSLTTGPPPGAFDGTTVYALGMRPGLPDPRGLVTLGRIVAHEQPDVVQTWLYHADLVGLLAAKWKTTAAVAWNLRCAALTVQESSRAVVAVRTVLARLSSFPDVVVANSEAGREAHQAYGYHPRRWAVIPNGFDTSVLQPDATTRARTRAALKVRPTTTVIGLVARLHAIKDHGTFFEASAELVRTHPDVVFVLAGLGLESGNPTVKAFFDRFGLDPAHSPAARHAGPDRTAPAGLRYLHAHVDVRGLSQRHRRGDGHRCALRGDRRGRLPPARRRHGPRRARSAAPGPGGRVALGAYARAGRACGTRRAGSAAHHRDLFAGPRRRAVCRPL